jgi:hypothetical protein
MKKSTESYLLETFIRTREIIQKSHSYLNVMKAENQLRLCGGRPSASIRKVT